ncbi:MAG: trehalose-6-phosphate synthase [Nitrospiraceae bacterium]
MRLSLRFILPLAVVLALLAYAVIPLVERLTLKWFVRDLDSRSQMIAHTIEPTLPALLAPDASGKLLTAFHRLIQDERLYAVGFCDVDNKLVHRTVTFPDAIGCPGTGSLEEDDSMMVELPQGSVHVAAVPLHAAGKRIGSLILLHDMSWVERRSADTKWYLFYLFAIIGGVISLVTVLVAHLSWRGWITGVRALVRGKGHENPLQDDHGDELQPVAQDLRTLFQELASDQRMRDESQVSWSPTALRTILHDQLAGDEILIVSNRQPYIHNWRGAKIDVQLPASGLVTALEPVMRACSGVWIAHGNGSADRDVVDHRDHVRVPPDAPAYDIRRVWMSPDEEMGYYYGFANEGLWPLCHVAHVRPVFRSSDWKQYVEINERFARAVQEEAKTDNPVVLVQDYHFALLPKMIRDRLPNATIITFWHIPWPNAELFGICPWQEQLLEGLLGSSILGFHTRVHCNNFLDSVDRSLEARIDRHSSTISFGGKLTAVNPYPISIEWPSRWTKQQESIDDCRAYVRAHDGIDPQRRIGIGVDRLDYTKGILERLMAVERLLELQPEWIGQFSFIQIAAPSRAIIDQYQYFTKQVTTLAETINRRFGREGYQPVYLKIEHHEPADVFRYFRGSDVCLVTSLHDGMNLVAKEFLAARDDEQGVLILSQFTGAAGELPEALVVNPYNIDQCAAALHLALTMSPEEQRTRMRTMRNLIQEFNVYRWAGRMLMDAARIRQRQRVQRRTTTTEKMEGTRSW